MTPPKPTKPCYHCGSTDYYLLDNGWGPPIWRCGKCHPKPSVLAAEGVTSSLGQVGPLVSPACRIKHKE